MYHVCKIGNLQVQPKVKMQERQNKTDDAFT